MRFIPNTEKGKKEMLQAIAVKSSRELFADIPTQVLLQKELNLPAALNERELRKEIESIAALNKTAKQLSLFLGAGCYNHFIPATVPAITGRSEFYTAYTPYQPEIAQGILQAIFEWQTYICLLTGMDVANASMYDGASATAEAMVTAKNVTGRKNILVAKSLNPEYKAVVETYANASSLQLREIESSKLDKEIDNET
ncbi:MAG: glycine dehydrogenase, partial [Candidatus Diapherotrites archaeon]|nr:glycine dehydrogenase [Candidatus Diapherotrites archaeon]